MKIVHVVSALDLGNFYHLTVQVREGQRILLEEEYTWGKEISKAAIAREVVLLLQAKLVDSGTPVAFPELEGQQLP